MIVYHGSTEKIKNWKLDQGEEYGIYFTPDITFAKAYGNEITEVKLNISKLLNATIESNLEKIFNLVPEFINVINEELGEELDKSEIIENENNLCFSLLQDSSLKIDKNNYLREVLVKRAKESGYDSILINDYTDGDEHEAYIVLNLNVIK